LRERAEDIPLLVRHFLARDPRGPRQVEPDSLETLMRYSWPGNVRELANVIERAKILADGATITVRDLPLEIVNPSQATQPPAVTSPAPSRGQDLSALERQHIVRVLESEGGNKVRAARALGISRRRLYRLLDKHDISRPSTPSAGT